jgi:nicotinamide phosphoribosyltransferase
MSKLRSHGVNPLTAIDFYKADHRRQYPEGTEYVYSNFTPRSSHLFTGGLKDFDNRVVVWGVQGFIKWFLIDTWNREFFEQPKEEVCAAYKRRMDNALGPDAVATQHFEDLHDLGYLPLRIKALPEGSRCPIGVPMLTIRNTKPEFFWLVNYLETVLSAELWKPMTTATIAYEYRRLLDTFAERTGADPTFSVLQGHDFSSRGMSGIGDASCSGSGHLLSFIGTDSVSAIDYAETYYDADSDAGPIGVSVPATEHSVMCMGGQEDEIGTFKRLITELYPTGIVSIVSDTWDFWKVLTEYAPALREEIMGRQPNALGLNKVVFRPDSGDPVKIICGDKSQPAHTPEHKGAVQCLWEEFGGTVNEKGYRTLDQHVGLIYGDSITLKRARRILDLLEKQGFTSDNIVFGIGSYTYQFLTRDTFGFAMKATWGQVNGEGRDIFKDPVTDDGRKKSAKGLLHVEPVDGTYVLRDQVSKNMEHRGALETVFHNGDLVKDEKFEDIRLRLHG